MTVYAVDRLINETRKVAAEYHSVTGQVLPVSNEIARHDVAQIMGLIPPETPQSGIDLIGISSPWQDWCFQVKSRVLFGKTKQKARIGQINFDAEWHAIILVVMDPSYMAQAFYLATKDVLSQALQAAPVTTRTQRGALSVAKFKTLSQLIWQRVSYEHTRS